MTTASDNLRRVRRTTSVLRAVLQNFRFGIGLVAFTPIDAAYLALQSHLPTRDFALDFFAWLALLVGGLAFTWKQCRAVRQTRLREPAPGETQAPSPEDSEGVGAILAGEVAGLLGIFGVLMASGDPSHKIGANWEWGFRLGGISLMALGAFWLYRYANPKLRVSTSP